MASDGQYTKWSLKASDHNARRVRNNQRRHRTRVKSRIAELGAALADTQQRLEAAEARVSELSTEIERLQSLVNEMTSETHQPPVLSRQGWNQNTGLTANEKLHASASHSLTQSQSSGITTADPWHSSFLYAFENDCSSLPNAERGESTIECKLAYKIIEQQNFRQLDVRSIQEWLKPGFRKGSRPGQGCCVNTNLLYAFIDVNS